MLQQQCTVCAGTTSGPTNFLLPCQICSHFYHHRCHRPPIPEKALIAVIHDHNDAYQKARGSTDPVPWNWKCASCITPRPLSPDIQIIDPRIETAIDLTFSDSDGEQANFLIERPAKTADTKQYHIEEDIKPIQDEQVKFEEQLVRLPPPKHNLAPAWIHKQYPDSPGDHWNRLSRKTPTRRPRKSIFPAMRQPAGQPFVFSASYWLEARRRTLPSQQMSSQVSG
ncbi:hypothetical protein C0991_000755 [Blastosporella zonata]|nr:hypothetical protein C0991_000755 [Blastosporella zonata]